MTNPISIHEHNHDAKDSSKSYTAHMDRTQKPDERSGAHAASCAEDTEIRGKTLEKAQALLPKVQDLDVRLHTMSRMLEVYTPNDHSSFALFRSNVARGEDASTLTLSRLHNLNIDLLDHAGKVQRLSMLRDEFLSLDASMEDIDEQLTSCMEDLSQAKHKPGYKEALMVFRNYRRKEKRLRRRIGLVIRRIYTA